MKSWPLVSGKMGDCSWVPIGCGHYPWRMIWDKLQDRTHNQWEIEIGPENFGKIVITEIAKEMMVMVIVMNIVGPWIKSKLLCDLISDLCFSPLFWSFLLYEITFGTRAGRQQGGGGQYKTFQTCLLLQILLDCSSSNINPPISSILTSIISICQHVQMLTFTKIRIQKNKTHSGFVVKWRYIVAAF